MCNTDLVWEPQGDDPWLMGQDAPLEKLPGFSDSYTQSEGEFYLLHSYYQS